MSATTLIMLDTVFVLIVIMLWATDEFKNHPVIFEPLVSIAFVTCVIRHINYYKTHKRIF